MPSKAIDLDKRSQDPVLGHCSDNCSEFGTSEQKQEGTSIHDRTARVLFVYPNSAIFCHIIFGFVVYPQWETGGTLAIPGKGPFFGSIMSIIRTFLVLSTRFNNKNA